MTTGAADGFIVMPPIMHGQVTRAAHDGFLPTSEAKHWIREIRVILVNLHIEFFNNLGQLALSQEQPGQARLAFERGVQYLRNQPDPVTYQQQLQAMEKQLARATRVGLDELGSDGPTEADFFNPRNGHWADAQLPVSWLNADAALEQQELHEILQRCQARLSPQQGAVFAMRFVEELSAEEICQELGLTASNYWVLVHRAKLQLRRCLEKHGLGKN